MFLKRNPLLGKLIYKVDLSALGVRKETNNKDK